MKVSRNDMFQAWNETEELIHDLENHVEYANRKYTLEKLSLVLSILGKYITSKDVAEALEWVHPLP